MNEVTSNVEPGELVQEAEPTHTHTVYDVEALEEAYGTEGEVPSDQ